MKKIFFEILLSTVLFIQIWSFASQGAKKEQKLIFLSNSKVEIGILPEVGGRIVLLRSTDGKNILKEAPEFWNEPERDRPRIEPNSIWKPYHGIIVWVGPQTTWWADQDFNIDRKKNNAQWPPDPYLIYGKYTIIENKDNYIKMIGPESKVSGIQLIKEIWLDEVGKVTFKVTGKNIRQKEISWNLWINIRMNGFDRCYIPVESERSFAMKYNFGDKAGKIKYKLVNGYFTFIPEIQKEYDQLKTKANIHPEKGIIAGFHENSLLLINFNIIDSSLIHHEQRQVEIYNQIGPDVESTVLELENQSAYVSLLPGETLEFTQTWQLFTYEGKWSPEAHIQYLNEILN